MTGHTVLAQDRRLNVGVTLHVRKGTQSLWENGIFQNCVFMAQLLRQSPLVQNVYIVCGGEGEIEDRNRFLGQTEYPLLSLEEALPLLDVTIEMSAGLHTDWVNTFRARGGKVISYYVGNDFFLDAERIVFNLPNAWLVPDAPRDRIWTLAEYERTCQPYYAAAVRAPVQIMQHLWAPDLVQTAAGASSLDYRPGSRRWRVGIAEPNLSFVKTCHIPLLSIEIAHRTQPDGLKAVHVFNGRAHINKPCFVAFCDSLDIVRHGLVTFEDRHPVIDILRQHVDALVCHHWENGQNYLYYEALHFGFPLIHNSPFLDGCGYRYADFDCEDGGRQLLHAYRTHDGQLPAYRAAARTYLQRLSPCNPTNIKAYTDEIRALMQP